MDRVWIKSQPEQEQIKRLTNEENLSLIEKLEKSPENGQRLYSELLKRGVEPNAFTFYLLLTACDLVAPKNKRFAHEVVIHMKTLGLRLTEKVFEVLGKIFSDREDCDWSQRYERVFREDEKGNSSPGERGKAEE